MTIEELLSQEGGAAITKIQSNITSSGQNASGRTSNSLKSTVSESDGITRLVIDAARHFTVLETGRKPGKMPPVGAIQQWIVDKPLDERKGLAWAISKVIARDGTKLFQEGGRKDIFSNVLNDTFVSDITNKVADITLKATAERIK